MYLFFFCNKHHATSNNISWSAWRDIKAGPVNWAVGYPSLFLVTQFKQSVCHLFFTQRSRKNNTALRCTGGPGHCDRRLGVCVTCGSSARLGFQAEKGVRKPAVPRPGDARTPTKLKSDCKMILQSCISCRGAPTLCCDRLPNEMKWSN